MSATRPHNASRRTLFLAGPVVLLLGGCVSTMDQTVERSFVEQISQAEPAEPQAIAKGAADDGEWRLRLSYL